MNNSRLDNQDGRTPSSDDLTSAKVDAIFNYGSSTPRDQQILGQFTTVTLNLAITRLQAGSGLTQHNDNLCRGATIDISGIAGAPAFFGIDHLTVGQ